MLPHIPDSVIKTITNSALACKNVACEEVGALDWVSRLKFTHWSPAVP